MRRRRRIERRPSHERWLVSYADFITLLFAFFVVMYSAAQLDQRRAGRLATAIQTAFQQYGSLPPLPAESGGFAPKGNPRDTSVANSEDQFQFLRGHVQEALAPEIAKGDVAVRNTPEGLVISLREVGFFDSGSAEIRASSAAAFERLAKVLSETPSDIRIEGHTDNVPIHNARFVSNWDLSTARATTTVRLLVTEYGFSPRRLAAAGYAEYRPIATNGNAAGRAMNGAWTSSSHGKLPSLKLRLAAALQPFAGRPLTPRSSGIES
jgi:chemotaxis protein MotB